MSTFRFITFTDVHVSNVNPASRVGSYKDDILAKLEQVRIVGEKVDAAFFILAGDLFNLKAPMRNPHALNTTLINLFKTFPSKVYAIEGNHDLRNDSYDTFNEQPLSVIYASRALTRLTDKDYYVPEKAPLYIHGEAFSEEPDLSKIPKPPVDGRLSICVLHLYSSEPGGTLFRTKIYSYRELSELGYDIYVMGHYHIDQGIQTVNYHGKDQTFINVGALSRGSLDEDNIDRTPKIGLITVEEAEGKYTWKAQGVRLKVKPADEVFDIEKKKEDKKKLKEAEEFVEKLKSDITDSTDQSDNVVTELGRLALEKAVLDKATHYLTEADLSLKEVVS